MRERFHRPGPAERVDLANRVQQGQRLDAVRLRGGELESDRTPDVVHEEVVVVEPERVDGGGAVAAEPGPGVVEIGRPLCQPKPGQIECDPTHAPRGQFGHHLAV